MQADEIIVLGDQVELILEDNKTYKTKIEDVTDTGLLLVAVPSLGGIQAPLYIDDRISLGFYRESGRYTTTMEVVAFEKQGEAQFVWLLQITVPFHHQRRGEFRLPTIMDVNVCEYVDGIEKEIPLFGEVGKTVVVEKVSTRDISVSGVAIKTTRDYEYGEKYLLKMPLEGPQQNTKPFLVCAEVMRVTQSSDGRINFIGMQYYGISNNRSEILARFVFSQQQQLIRQRRYID